MRRALFCSELALTDVSHINPLPMSRRRPLQRLNEGGAFAGSCAPGPTACGLLLRAPGGGSNCDLFVGIMTTERMEAK